MTSSWIGRVAGALAVMWGTGAVAQNYPTKNVTIVVPLAAGTGMDAIVAHLCGGARPRRWASRSWSRTSRVPR